MNGGKVTKPMGEPSVYFSSKKIPYDCNTYKSYTGLEVEEETEGITFRFKVGYIWWKSENLSIVNDPERGLP